MPYWDQLLVLFVFEVLVFIFLYPLYYFFLFYNYSSLTNYFLNSFYTTKALFWVWAFSTCSPLYLVFLLGISQQNLQLFVISYMFHHSRTTMMKHNVQKIILYLDASKPCFSLHIFMRLEIRHCLHFHGVLQQCKQ